jgi:trk system potassium uptake protein TrkH
MHRYQDNLKIICRDLGNVLLMVSIVNLLPIFISLFFGEYGEIFWIIVTTGILFTAGGLLRLIGRKTKDEPMLRHAVVVAALSWIIIPAITAIPLMFITHVDFLSGLFETMSGWTTTGLSMYTGSEETLSHTILFYRSYLQWLGGIGMVVLTVTVLARPGTGAFTLYYSEAREDRIKPNIRGTLYSIWWIYFLVTCLGIILLFIFGMPLWDSLNHTMAAVSTGGFGIKNTNFQAYPSVPIEVIITILMIFGATSFFALHKLFTGKITKFFQDVQVKTLIFLYILGGVILTLMNLSFYNGDVSTSFRYSTFQYISAESTTGFSNANILSWNPDAKLILAFGMIIGGAAGATCGGIKAIRATLLAKGASWRIKKLLAPNRRIFVYKLGEKYLTKESQSNIVNEAAILSFLWMICLIIGIFVIMWTTTGYTTEDVIFEVCAAQGNAGLSTGITNIAMAPLAKAMLIISMYIGRLEIIPIIAMFVAIIHRR